MTFEEIRNAVNAAWRDYVVNGVPATGPNEPVKQEIRAALLKLTVAMENGGFSAPPNWAADLAEVQSKLEDVDAVVAGLGTVSAKALEAQAAASAAVAARDDAVAIYGSIEAVEAAATTATDAIDQMLEIASGAPDAPSILNKVNRNGSNVEADSFRGAIGAASDTKTISLFDYGAKGDGSAGDEPKIRAAFAAANAMARPGMHPHILHPGVTVVIPRGSYNLDGISATIEIKCNVVNEGADFLVPAAYAGEVLRVGYDVGPNLLATADIDLPNVVKAVGSPVVAGSVGIRLANINASRIQLGRISYFDTNLRLGGIGEGTVYNDIFLGQLFYANKLIEMRPGAGGWCNANNLYSGNMRQGGVRVPGQYHVYMDGSAPATAVVGNNFYGTAFEGPGSDYVVFAKMAYGNNFFGIYNETQDAYKSATVSGDTMTSAAHGLSVGDLLFLNATTLPGGLFGSTPYWVVSVPTADTFKISSNRGGAAVVTSSAGVGFSVRRQGRCLFDGTSGALTNNNKFINPFSPPDISMDFIQTGQAQNNGQDRPDAHTSVRFSPDDSPIYRGSNTSGTAPGRPIFAAYAPTVDPASQPQLWRAAVSDVGFLFRDAAGATTGRLWNSFGVLRYESNGDGVVRDIATCVRSPSLVTLPSTVIPAGGRGVAVVSVTGATVGSFVTPMFQNALPDGIAVAWCRVNGAGTVQIAFYNWTATPIDLAGAQIKVMVTSPTV